MIAPALRSRAAAAIGETRRTQATVMTSPAILQSGMPYLKDPFASRGAFRCLASEMKRLAQVVVTTSKTVVPQGVMRPPPQGPGSQMSAPAVVIPLTTQHHTVLAVSRWAAFGWRVLKAAPIGAMP
jgi:hypothetical protein